MNNSGYTYDGLGLPVVLTDGYSFRDTKYGRTYCIEDLEELTRRLASKVIGKPGRLAPKEFLFLRNFLDMSQSKLGGNLGVGAQTVARWEKGEITIPKYGDSVLRFLIEEHLKGSVVVTTFIEKLNEIDEQECLAYLASRENETWTVHCDKEATG